MLKVIATLDAILNKMADVLDDSFEPSEPESIKLLREFRATMNSRRAWVKFYVLCDGNEDTDNMSIKKVETKVNNQVTPPTKNPVIMNKQEGTIVNGIFFEGIKCKNNNPIPQIDLNNGLAVRR